MVTFPSALTFPTLDSERPFKPPKGKCCTNFGCIHKWQSIACPKISGVYMNWLLFRRAWSYMGVGFCLDNILAYTLTLLQPRGGGQIMSTNYLGFSRPCLESFRQAWYLMGVWLSYKCDQEDGNFKLQIVSLKKGGIFLNLFVKKICIYTISESNLFVFSTGFCDYVF